jgi:hypothetical protein
VLLWDDEEVKRGLGVNIVKGNKVFVFIGLFCRNLAKNNLAENTV